MRFQNYLPAVIFAGFAILSGGAFLFAQDTPAAAKTEEEAVSSTPSMSDWAVIEKDYKALRADRDNIMAQVKVAYDERNKAVDDLTAAVAKCGHTTEETAELQKKLEALQTEKDRLDERGSLLESETKEISDELEAVKKLNETLTEENQALLNRPPQTVAEAKTFEAPKSMLNLIKEKEKLARENADLHYNLGVMMTKNQEYKKAVLEFSRAVQLNPKDAASYFNLGKLYADHLHDKSQAIGFFEKYLKLQPEAEDAGWVKSFIAMNRAFRGDEKLSE